MPRSYDWGWKREWQDYLRALLHSLADAEIRVALERLPADDDRVWVGAYRYSEYSGTRGDERMAAIFTVEWLARVASRAYPLADEYESRSIIDRLAKRPAEATNRFCWELPKQAHWKCQEQALMGPPSDIRNCPTLRALCWPWRKIKSQRVAPLLCAG
jgi:hypothetical protein